MASTEEILKAAAELGKRIGEHEVARRMKSMLEKLQADTEAQRLLEDYHRHVQAIGEKESRGLPIEVDDKRKLQRLQGAVAMNPLLRDFQLVQMDYMDLMRRVDDAIEGTGAAPELEPGGAASAILTGKRGP